MKRFLFLVAVAFTALPAGASPAMAHDNFECNGTFTGETFDDDVIVPAGGACTLFDSTVADDVKVPDEAYFQSTGTAIGGDVKARQAQTIFIDTGSRIFGRIDSDKTIQVFIFNSKLIRKVDVERTSVVQICGNVFSKGDVQVERSGRDILIGDPLAVDCAGNVVRRGDLEVERNFTDVEFVVRGNTIRKGDLEVFKNTGPVPKYVTGNTGGDRLKCKENSPDFFATPTLPGELPNTGWDHKQGQCT